MYGDSYYFRSKRPSFISVALSACQDRIQSIGIAWLSSWHGMVRIVFFGVVLNVRLTGRFDVSFFFLCNRMDRDE